MSSTDVRSTRGTDAEIDIAALLADPAEQKENLHDQDPDLEVPPEDPGDDDGGGGGASGHLPQPIGATCLQQFSAVHNSGSRPVSAIRLIVIHSTEGPTAAGAASWFANPDSQGSAHVIVDEQACYRTLEDTRIPWGAPGANTNGFHVEHAGFASWDRERWMTHEQTLRRGAFKAAFHAVKFGVPRQLLTSDDLRRGRSGFVTHATVTKAFTPGGHTDPGPGFPLDHYMQLVEQFAQQIASS